MIRLAQQKPLLGACACCQRLARGAGSRRFGSVPGCSRPVQAQARRAHTAKQVRSAGTERCASERAGDDPLGKHSLGNCGIFAQNRAEQRPTGGETRMQIEIFDVIEPDPLECVALGVVPVSYTHLDVYKRQYEGGADAERAEHGIGIRGGEESDEVEDGTAADEYQQHDALWAVQMLRLAQLEAAGFTLRLTAPRHRSQYSALDGSAVAQELGECIPESHDRAPPLFGRLSW